MTGSIVCALLVTAGLFLLTGIRPRDMTEGLMKPFEKEVNRKKRIRHMTGKKPSSAQRMMEEAVTMLDASGKGEQVSTYRNMAILLAVVGFLFGLVIDNLPVSLVLSIGLAMTPLTIIRMRTAEYGRMVDEKLEMAMGSVTNSYIATGNLLTAVERVLPMLPAPVGDIFKRFQVDMQYVDGNTVRAIQHMRDGGVMEGRPRRPEGGAEDTVSAPPEHRVRISAHTVRNLYWTEWCNALIQCQDDVSLNRTLSGIVERLSEMRQIQMEVDTTLRKHMSDYIVTVMLVLGSIPLMGFMIPDWYDMLMTSIPGKITLAIVLATVLITSVWVSRAHALNEGGEQE